MTSTSAKREGRSLPVQIVALTSTRIVMNTGFRMMYPLLPVFARAVEVDVATIATVITVQQLSGLSAPIVGTLSERRGRRFTFLMGLIIYIVGVSMVFVSPNFVGLGAALLISAMGKLAYDPAVQAYIGDRVPYERRGFYLGALEFGWSGAFLLGVPLMTWAIAQGNWQTPFALLAILTGISLAITAYVTEPDRPDVIKRVNLRQAIRLSVNSKAAVAGLVLGFGISAANQLVNVVFGAWIEASFGIILTALAASAAVIGVSELLGEGVVTGLSDRIGKRRLVIVGIVGNIIACLLLPFSNTSLTMALIGLFFFYLTFETALVATLPLVTELSPQARGMYMTVFVAAVTVGRAIFTPLSPMLFETSLLLNCLMAVALNGLALVATWRYIRLA